MDTSLEQVLKELSEIRERLANLDPGSPERVGLEARRNDLRDAAQEVTDAARNPANMRAELEHLESRLAAIEGEKIKVPAWQVAMSGRFSINDPAAYAHGLNDALDAANELDRTAIERRILRLKKALAE